MPLIAIGCVVAVFVVCSFIDWLRIKLVEAPFMRKILLLEPKFMMWWNNKEEKLCKKFNVN